MNNAMNGRSGTHVAGSRAGHLAEILILTAILAVPTAVPAQVSSNEINYFSRCRDIREAQARLDCYDDLYDRAVRALTPRNDPDRLMDENRRMREELARIRQQTGPGPASEEVQGYSRNTPTYSAAQDRAAEFGRPRPAPAVSRAEDFGKKAPDVVKDENGKDVLSDRIAALQKGQNGWVVTLDSGQVWRQMYSKSYNLREGQQVKIAPTIWGGAYRLSVSTLGGFIQVERMK